MTYYRLLDTYEKEKKELNENCTCDGFTLLHYGCQCSNEKLFHPDIEMFERTSFLREFPNCWREYDELNTYYQEISKITNCKVYKIEYRNTGTIAIPLFSDNKINLLFKNKRLRSLVIQSHNILKEIIKKCNFNSKNVDHFF